MVCPNFSISCSEAPERRKTVDVYSRVNLDATVFIRPDTVFWSRIIV
jgi:hypothetical protein